MPSTATRFDFDCAQAGLIAGTVPTKGAGKVRAQILERQSRGGVARYHDEIGRVLRDGLADDVGDARDQRVFGEIAIGKAGIVRHIDVSRVRPHGGDLAEDGESADAGIEDQNCRSVCHRSRDQAAPNTRLKIVSTCLK